MTRTKKKLKKFRNNSIVFLIFFYRLLFFLDFKNSFLEEQSTFQLENEKVTCDLIISETSFGSQKRE